MTFLEKTMQDVIRDPNMIARMFCPEAFGYDRSCPVINGNSDVTCTDCWNMEMPGTKKEETMDDNVLLSMDALLWLSKVGYGEKTHDERMILIKAAKIAYPNKDEL